MVVARKAARKVERSFIVVRWGEGGDDDVPSLRGGDTVKVGMRMGSVCVLAPLESLGTTL